MIPQDTKKSNSTWF